MLRFSAGHLSRMPYAGNNSRPYPFPGRYPTRIYFRGNKLSYFGKPTTGAWRQFLRAKQAPDGDWHFYEIDRRHILRSYSPVQGVYHTNTWRNYYLSDYPQNLFLNTPHEVGRRFRPVRLREGVMYVSEQLAQNLGFTRESLLSRIRRRLRGDLRELVRTNDPLDEEGEPLMPPRPAPTGGNALDVARVFTQVARERRAVPPAPARPEATGTLMTQNAGLTFWQGMAADVGAVQAAPQAQTPRPVRWRIGMVNPATGQAVPTEPEETDPVI